MPKGRHRHATHTVGAPPLDLEDQIRMRAYELYLERSADPGHDLDDWLRAEQEVRVNAKSGNRSTPSH